jgi:single-stranded DNA-binding protein
MTEAARSFAGNLTDDPELRHTEAEIARARFRVAVRARKEQEASFFTRIMWRDQLDRVLPATRPPPSRRSPPASRSARP